MEDDRRNIFHPQLTLQWERITTWESQPIEGIWYFMAYFDSGATNRTLFQLKFTCKPVAWSLNFTERILSNLNTCSNDQTATGNPLSVKDNPLSVKDNLYI